MARKKNQSVSKPVQEWRSRWPVIRFVGGFVVLSIIYFTISSTAWFNKLRHPILVAYTKISSWTLNVFNLNTSTNQDILYNNQFSVNIEEGCDAVGPAILYTIAILVYPIAFKYKWKGILAGLVFIFILNIIRIISLFLTGVYSSSLFDFMHVEFWQGIFIVFTLALWLGWLQWAFKRAKING